MYVESIKPGFNSMEVINAFAKSIRKPIDCKMVTLKAYNKKHRTKYASWDELSVDVYKLTSFDIVEYHSLLNWYLMYKTNKDRVEFLISLLNDKDKKKIHEHTLQSFLF